jgi:hypothetical protein
VTTKTRRTIFLAVLALVLTLPAETILLKALQSPTDSAAVRTWVGSLDSAELTSAAGQIESYPFAYRKEILRALAPDQRSLVWRAHIARYVKAHPELDSAAVNALKAAISVATPDAFSGDVSAATRLSTSAVAEQVASLLGRDTAKYLFYYVGPPDGTFASAEPMMMKMASFVRNNFVVLARTPDCDCATSFGCDGYDQLCRDTTYCVADESWPACGWWLNEPCNGICEGGY